ncbi:AraC family transcriptional regulator [Paenibacillus doosanensis]|uniref:HTH-type transcriptional activator RhaR n=1 Tax=Paenibacillus konkukensis TaxID=2020716 RepID=A0ABY4RNR7_9BACL|nr:MULTISPECIES: AraC family transcriptional regulator [Paenibacillus]MCS7459042.1 AraC family transcriptional regulator [Paenibacillus doosanensis]UQZ84096.1 HTH-type transcriptional activator RhaR [Paenibacillus konkukensis]
MLIPHEACARTSFGFKYISPAELPIRLINIGWDRVAAASYRWNGMERGGGLIVFQYTLAGKGMLRDGERLYALPKDTGFMTVVPGDQEYYFPEGGEEWEFLYIVVNGADALSHFTTLIKKLGPVVSFREHREPLAVLSRLYAEVYRDPELDKYTISARLYELLMSLHRLAEGRDIVRTPEEMPDSVRAAIKLMKSRFAADLSVEDMAAAAGLSKYHFCRQFSKKTGLTPNQYLRKIRIEQAAWLLRHTDMTVESVGRETGFEYTNYFIKVFRSFVGTTPSEYRIGKTGDPVYFLRIEP